MSLSCPWTSCDSTPRSIATRGAAVDTKPLCSDCGLVAAPVTNVSGGACCWVVCCFFVTGPRCFSGLYERRNLGNSHGRQQTKRCGGRHLDWASLKLSASSHLRSVQCFLLVHEAGQPSLHVQTARRTQGRWIVISLRSCTLALPYAPLPPLPPSNHFPSMYAVTSTCTPSPSPIFQHFPCPALLDALPRRRARWYCPTITGECLFVPRARPAEVLSQVGGLRKAPGSAGIRTLLPTRWSVGNRITLC